MVRTRAYPTELYLCTTILRQDNDGQPVECDAIVYFEARMTARAGKATWTDPGWAAEYECTFSTADLDGIPHDAPGPLTVIETDALRTWFDTQEQAAWETANDNHDRE